MSPRPTASVSQKIYSFITVLSTVHVEPGLCRYLGAQSQAATHREDIAAAPPASVYHTLPRRLLPSGSGSGLRCSCSSIHL